MDDGQRGVEYLEISPRTLQRYRTNRIIAFSICGKKIRYRRTDVEQFRERWMRETPDKQIDRMIEQHPLHERKYWQGRVTGWTCSATTCP